MKRVLLVANYKSGIGGISVQVNSINEKLIEENIKSEIFSTKGSILFRFFSIFRLLVVGRKFDVFHIHGCSYLGFFPIVVGCIIGKILKKKIVITFHGGDANDFFAKHTKFVRFFLTKSDENIVLSGFLGEVFDKYKIPYIVIPNLIELSKNTFKQRDKFEPNFISVRSLRKLYNIECILKAFAEVQSTYTNAKLQILGDGNYRDKLEEYAKELKLKNVDFIGQVSSDDIYKHLSKADVFLSSPYVDNQPVSILEAFNAGLLVISSNVGGIPYMIKDGETGLMFGSNNCKELAEKMIFAIQQQDISKRMVLNAYNELEKYTWQEIKYKLLKLY